MALLRIYYIKFQQFENLKRKRNRLVKEMQSHGPNEQSSNKHNQSDPSNTQNENENISNTIDVLKSE